MEFGKAMHVMYYPVASALRSMMARMDYHGKPALIAQQMGLGAHPQAFDGVRVLIRMSELVERYHLNRQRTPEEVSNATPLAALNFEASVEEKATDLARVILAGRLTDEEKHYLYYERLIKPVPVEKDGQVVGFQWEHPRAPVEIAADIDWDVFSGDSVGTVHRTEEECWVDAYVAKATWTTF